MPRLLLIAVLSIFALTPASALGAKVPEGAVYSEEYIPSSSPVPNDDDPTLHADVLRPKNATGKVPVILTVSPYTNHSQSGGATYDPEAEGPNDRFFDYMDRDAKVFDKGYAYVIVDLRGTGGSGGCHDWGGPGEQDDVKRAVEWAASQPWSNGKVALYGKSYDAWTGLMGLAMRPKGLAAVISQEPVVDGYRYFWTNGVRISNTLGTPASFQLFDTTPGSVYDDPQYTANSSTSNVVKPGCNAQNVALQSGDNNHESDYWKPRNLVQRVKGANIPTFYMAGFLEDNTKPDAIFETWNNFATPDSHAWFGQWDHVRGNDRVKDEDGNPTDRFAAGRSTFVEETLRFLDEHLKGIEPSKQDPRITVQDGDGRFRSEQEWPPLDAQGVTTTVRGGTYNDNGSNNGDGSGAGKGIWSISQPLPHDAHLAGEQRMTVDVGSAAPRSNLVANLYEINAADKKATLVSRDAFLLSGPGKVELELHGQDWVFDKGNRLGVLLSPANAEWWRHVPTNQPVTIKSASITIPFLAFKRSSDLEGGVTPRLETVKRRAFLVPDAAFTDGATTFALPPEQTERPRPGAGPAPVVVPVTGGAAGEVVQATAIIERRAGSRSRTSMKRSLRIKLRARRLKGRRLLITGTAPKGMRLTLKVLRGRKVVAKRQVVARNGKIRLVVRLRRAGSHTVRATGRTGIETGSAAAPRSAKVR